MAIAWPWTSKQHRRQSEDESPSLKQAKQALAASTVQLAQAEGQRVVSQARRITLAEIRRNNHFTPSIFPEAK